jgi:hypothetical protein
MSNVSDFIKQLETIGDNDLIYIEVPSQKFKKHKFRAISVKQHKDLIKAAISGFIGNVKASVIYNKIVVDNCIDEIDFKAYERQHILTQLRKNSVGSKVTIEDKEYDLNDLPEFTYTPLPPTEYSYKNIRVLVDEPSLKKDTYFTEKSLIEIGRIPSDDNQVSAAMPILLTHEIIKYISSIQIDDTIISFEEITLYDKKSIVDNLPLKLNNILTDHITSTKEVVLQLFQFEDGVSLPFDPNFLTSE